MEKKFLSFYKSITTQTFRLVNLGLLLVCTVSTFVLLLMYGFENYTRSLMFNVVSDSLCLLFTTVIYIYCMEDPASKEGGFAVFTDFVAATGYRVFLDGLYWFFGANFHGKVSFTVVSILMVLATIYASMLRVEYIRSLTDPDSKKLKPVKYVFFFFVFASIVMTGVGVATGLAYDTEGPLFILFSLRPGHSVLLIAVSLIGYIACILMVLYKRKREITTHIFIVYFAVPILFYLTEFSIGTLELSGIIHYLIVSFLYNNAAVRQSVELTKTEKELSDQKMSIMLSQIQPHFIFNALNTICFLCRKDPKKAETATKSFASYLRMNIDSIGSTSLIPFSREINHVKTYVELEQLRFGDKLEVIYEIDEDNFDIPPLTLQPIVENAVKHGSCKKAETSVIKISCKREDEMMVIKVLDNGIGFVTTAVPNDEKTHVGISNVRNRVEGVCNGVFEIYSVPGTGTVVTIKVPVKKEK